MEKQRKLIIVGDSAFAEVAYEYFTHDSIYEVVAFSVETPFLTRNTLFDLPVVPFETLEQIYDPAKYWFFAALVYGDTNRLRARLYTMAKAKGYRAASYVSPRAVVWHNVQLGEHCFIFENTVLQTFTTIGADVVLWSGSFVGHHSRIGSHTFLAAHVAVSGFVSVGEYVFLGVNSAIVDRVVIGDRCVVGASALVLGNVPDDTTVVGVWKRPRPGADKA